MWYLYHLNCDQKYSMLAVQHVDWVRDSVSVGNPNLKKVHHKQFIHNNSKTENQSIVRQRIRAMERNWSRFITKPTKWHVRPAKTQISLGIRPVWSESSLSAWQRLWSLATHWAHSEDSNQTGRMPRLICVFSGRTVILLVLPRDGSYVVLLSVYGQSDMQETISHTLQ